MVLFHGCKSVGLQMFSARGVAESEASRLSLCTKQASAMGSANLIHPSKSTILFFRSAMNPLGVDMR